MRTSLTAKGWRWIQLQGSVAARTARPACVRADPGRHRAPAERRARALPRRPDAHARGRARLRRDAVRARATRRSRARRLVLDRRGRGRREHPQRRHAAQRPAKGELARELRRRFPVAADDPYGAAAVLASGRSQLYPEISEQLLAGGDAEHRGARSLPAARSLLGDRRAAAGPRPHDRRADADRGRDPAALRRGRPRLRRGGRAARGADDRQRTAAPRRAAGARGRRGVGAPHGAAAIADRAAVGGRLPGGGRADHRRREPRRARRPGRLGQRAGRGRRGAAPARRERLPRGLRPEVPAHPDRCRPRGLRGRAAGRADVGRVGGGGLGSLSGVRRGGAGDRRRGACRRSAHVGRARVRVPRPPLRRPASVQRRAEGADHVVRRPVQPVARARPALRARARGPRRPPSSTAASSSS